MTNSNRGNTSKSNRGRLTTTTPNSRKRSLSSSNSSSSNSSPTNFSGQSTSDSGLPISSVQSRSLGSRKKRQNTGITENTLPLTTSDDDAAAAPTEAAAMNLMSPSSLSLQSPTELPQKLVAHRNVPAFLNKLYSMVEDPTTTDFIRWSDDGTSFIVERHEEFAKTVLPRFYKHNTFASFVRQLNMYDFHKVPHLQQGVLISDSKHEIWEFSNPHFQRGRPDMLVLVTRKRNRDRKEDTENVSLSSIVKDITAIRKHQSTISADLRNLHRDNEILWEETLTAREKYQRHQEVMGKILQFLTTVFSNDRSQLSQSKHESIMAGESIECGSLGNDQSAIDKSSTSPVVGNVPRNLIEEAASLAGMVPSNENSKTGKYNLLPRMELLETLLSASRLYSSLPPRSASSPNPGSNTSQEYDSYSIQQPPGFANASNPTEIPRDIQGYSETLDMATRSVQSISQDIDDLQLNVEALASDLGIHPEQFTSDFTTTHLDQFENEHRLMISSATQYDKNKLFELAGDPMVKNYYSSEHVSSKSPAATSSSSSSSSATFEPVPAVMLPQQQQAPAPTPEVSNMYGPATMDPSLYSSSVDPLRQSNLADNGVAAYPANNNPSAATTSAIPIPVPVPFPLVSPSPTSLRAPNTTNLPSQSDYHAALLAQQHQQGFSRMNENGRTEHPKSQKDQRNSSKS